MDTENQPVLLDAPVDDDHHNDRDQEEEEKDNIDGRVALSRPLCQLSLFLSSPGRKFTQIGGSKTGQI